MGCAGIYFIPLFEPWQIQTLDMLPRINKNRDLQAGRFSG
jgi:hypothetical protein